MRQSPTHVYDDGSYAAAHPDWHAAASSWKAARVLRLLHKVPSLQPNDVCEVGCGMGGVIADVAMSLGISGSGCDISQQVIDNASELHPEIEFSVGSLPAEHHDLVLAMDVIEHVVDVYGFVAGMREIASAGIFHIPLDLSVQSLIRPRQLDRIRADLCHLHFFTKETALSTLRAGGFNIETWEYSPAFELAGSRSSARIAHLPRRFGFAFTPELTARIIGGCSLLVLAQ